VRNLVERHGGSVSAHSEGVGRGSEFVVRMPKTEATTAVEDIDRSSWGTAAPISPTQARRILVVDDNEDGAAMLSEALKARGHDARVAHDAPAALQIAESFTPDIAFLDIGLPVMDGYELARRLRGLPGLSSIRLIAITGYGQQSDREKSQVAGFCRHLVKPVDLDIVEAVVNGETAAPLDRSPTSQ
jgi:CheY-like chemotaxis protein